MSLLAIETSTRRLGVALVEAEQLLASYELLADYPHAVELPDAVTRVLKAAKIPLHRLEALAIDVGPGSFTGLRIGLAFVKALAFASGKPLVGIASLDVLAAGLPFTRQPIRPVLDARQQNVYTAQYHWEGERLVRETDYLLGPLEEVVPASQEAVILVGDGCALYREPLLARCPHAQVAAAECWLPGTATLARLGQARWLRGERDDPARLVPLYLYPMDCSVRGPDRPTAVLPMRAAAAVGGVAPVPSA